MVSLFPHPASFRFYLAVDTLAFGYILPTTGRIRDFHPLETCAAGRTTKKNGTGSWLLVPFLIHGLYDFSLTPKLPELNDGFAVSAVSLALIDIVLLILMIRFFIRAKHIDRYNEPIAEHFPG